MAFGNVKAKEKRIKEVDDPIKLLKMKFAEGDITLDEFQQKYEVLSSLDKAEGIF